MLEQGRASEQYFLPLALRLLVTLRLSHHVVLRHVGGREGGPWNEFCDVAVKAAEEFCPPPLPRSVVELLSYSPNWAWAQFRDPLRPDRMACTRVDEDGLRYSWTRQKAKLSHIVPAEVQRPGHLYSAFLKVATVTVQRAAVGGDSAEPARNPAPAARSEALRVQLQDLGVRVVGCQGALPVTTTLSSTGSW